MAYEPSTLRNPYFARTYLDWRDDVVPSYMGIIYEQGWSLHLWRSSSDLSWVYIDALSVPKFWTPDAIDTYMTGYLNGTDNPATAQSLHMRPTTKP